MNIQPRKKREWPKFATGPLGNRARFECAGDVPVGWILDGMSEPLHKRTVPAAPPVAVKGKRAAGGA